MKLLKQLIEAPSSSANDYFVKELIIEILHSNKIDYTLDASGNLTATIDNGEKFLPAFCSHTDTVQKFIFDKCYESKGKLFCNNRGVGADDKAGIWIMLNRIKRHQSGIYLFFAGEEEGCRGSSDYAPDSETIKKTSCLIGIDRRGSKDICTKFSDYKTVSKEFWETIQPIVWRHGRKEESGLITDCFNIQEKFSVSTINISCGYYMPHTPREYIIINDLYTSEKFITDISPLLTKRRFDYTTKNPYRPMRYGYRDYFMPDETDTPDTTAELYDYIKELRSAGYTESEINEIKAEFNLAENNRDFLNY